MSFDNKEEVPGYGMPAIWRRHYRQEADVPEDAAVALLHLNDPNWDFKGSDTASFETSSFVSDDGSADPPPKFSSSFDMARASKAGFSDYDSESQNVSRMGFQSTEAVDYEE